MKSLIAAALLASLLALSPGARAQSATTPVDSIVAVIDEDVILRSELDRAVANIVKQFGNSQTHRLRRGIERPRDGARFVRTEIDGGPCDVARGVTRRQGRDRPHPFAEPPR